jgi:hypothetical protein
MKNEVEETNKTKHGRLEQNSNGSKVDTKEGIGKRQGKRVRKRERYRKMFGVWRAGG